MIGAVDIRELARAQALRDTIVEKDYVIGWLLTWNGPSSRLRTGSTRRPGSKSPHV